MVPTTTQTIMGLPITTVAVEALPTLHQVAIPIPHLLEAPLLRNRTLVQTG